MGAFEQAKGKAKEAVGDLADNPELKAEGRAQQDKGEAEREATEAKAEAKAQEAKAKEKELEQRAARVPQVARTEQRPPNEGAPDHIRGSFAFLSRSGRN